MSPLTKVTASVAATALVAAAFLLGGAPAAHAAAGPPEPYHEPSTGISIPIFGLIAIAGIATVAIWQGVKDAHKKKKEKAVEEQELEETSEFEEYFRAGTAEEEATPAEDESGADEAPAEDAAP